MNINMNNKYYEMHTDLLNLCEKNGIRVIAGKRVSYELLCDREINGIKEFLLMPDDMAKFYEFCAAELENGGYTLVKGKFRNYNICRVFREDILASTVPALMNNPDGRHSPQFILRELAVEEDRYSYTSNNRVIAFSKESASDLEKLPYMSSAVYVKKNLNDHLKEICGCGSEEPVPLPGYALFSNECTAADFLNEAAKRGLLSEKRIARYNEYTAWRKENRSENEKKYREYQDVLLGLKQP